MNRTGFLFAECLLESLLGVSDERLIAIRVDKNTGTILRIALQFGEHVEVPAMGSQKYIAGQSTQQRKGMLEILNDTGVAYRVARCSDEVVLRPKTRPSDDDDIPHRFRRLSWKVRAHGPCGTSARVAGSFVGRQRHTSKAYSVSVMENAVHVYGSVSKNVR